MRTDYIPGRFRTVVPPPPPIPVCDTAVLLAHPTTLGETRFPAGTSVTVQARHYMPQGWAVQVTHPSAPGVAFALGPEAWVLPE